MTPLRQRMIEDMKLRPRVRPGFRLFRLVRLPPTLPAIPPTAPDRSINRRSSTVSDHPRCQTRFQVVPVSPVPSDSPCISTNCSRSLDQPAFGSPLSARYACVGEENLGFRKAYRSIGDDRLCRLRNRGKSRIHATDLRVMSHLGRDRSFQSSLVFLAQTRPPTAKLVDNPKNFSLFFSLGSIRGCDKNIGEL